MKVNALHTLAVAPFAGSFDLNSASLVVLAGMLVLSLVLLGTYLLDIIANLFASPEAEPRTDPSVPDDIERSDDRPMEHTVPDGLGRTARRTAAAEALPSRDSIPGAAGARRRVLVVDDNATVLRFVERALGDTYAVTSACNGREALDAAVACVPDLIITDVMMPVMDGHELCRTVKQDPSLRHVPVVLLTALASHSDLIEGLEMGSDDYIFKPFNVRELKARVRNLILARDEQARLAAQNRELNSVSERKSELLSLAAHDLKNPLTAIRELAELVKQEVGDASDAYSPADLIYQSSDQMLQLISSLLESEAIEEGRIPMHPERVDVTQLAVDIIRRNDAIAGRKGQTIELRMPKKDCTVMADPHLMLEAMDNLVNNAVKYSPKNSGIHVAVHREGRRVRFSVTDPGPGIDEDEQQQLFKKFHRLSTQPTDGEASSGLGLSIVKKIVDMHDGTIEVRSLQGEGSTFTIELAAATPQHLPGCSTHGRRRQAERPE